MSKQDRTQMCTLLQDEENMLRLTGVLANYLTDNYDQDAADDIDDRFTLISNRLVDAFAMLTENPILLESEDIFGAEVNA
jgi:hypothetical protein